MSKTYNGIFEIEIDERDKISEILKAITKQWGITFEEVEEEKE